MLRLFHNLVHKTNTSPATLPRKIIFHSTPLLSVNPLFMDFDKKEKSMGQGRYVIELRPADVLMGRGHQNMMYEGNCYLRELVQARRQAYVSAQHNHEKTKIASSVLQDIQQRGGRFLKAVMTDRQRKQLDVPAGVDAWVCADDTVALEKIKQNFRDASNTPSIPKTIAAVIPKQTDELRASPVGIDGLFVSPRFQEALAALQQLRDRQEKQTGQQQHLSDVFRLIQEQQATRHRPDQPSVPQPPTNSAQILETFLQQSLLQRLQQQQQAISLPNLVAAGITLPGLLSNQGAATTILRSGWGTQQQPLDATKTPQNEQLLLQYLLLQRQQQQPQQPSLQSAITPSSSRSSSSILDSNPLSFPSVGDDQQLLLRRLLSSSIPNNNNSNSSNPSTDFPSLSLFPSSLHRFPSPFVSALAALSPMPRDHSPLSTSLQQLSSSIPTEQPPIKQQHSKPSPPTRISTTGMNETKKRVIETAVADDDHDGAEGFPQKKKSRHYTRDDCPGTE